MRRGATLCGVDPVGVGFVERAHVKDALEVVAEGARGIFLKRCGGQGPVEAQCDGRGHRMAEAAGPWTEDAAGAIA